MLLVVMYHLQWAGCIYLSPFLGIIGGKVHPTWQICLALIVELIFFHSTLASLRRLRADSFDHLLFSSSLSLILFLCDLSIGHA